MKSEDKASLTLNIVCFLGTGLISLCLGVAILAWWGLVIGGGMAVVFWSKSHRAKAAAWSSLACIACFLLALMSWPMFRVIAPEYFDENYNPKVSKAVHDWQQTSQP